MNKPPFTIMLPSWLFSEADLRVLHQRIEDAISPSSPITSSEEICLQSIKIELAFRKTEQYSAVAESTHTLIQEPKS